MATTSTIPTAAAALVTALEAEASLSGVTVKYGWPGPEAEQAPAELIYINPLVDDWSHELAGIKAGRKYRNETYALPVFILVAQPGGTSTTQATTEARAFALLGGLEDALADDVQFGTSAVQWGEVHPRQKQTVPYERGWLCQIEAEVEVHARLT